MKKWYILHKRDVWLMWSTWLVKVTRSIVGHQSYIVWLSRRSSCSLPVACSHRQYQSRGACVRVEQRIGNEESSRRYVIHTSARRTANLMSDRPLIPCWSHRDMMSSAFRPRSSTVTLMTPDRDAQRRHDDSLVTSFNCKLFRRIHEYRDLQQPGRISCLFLFCHCTVSKLKFNVETSNAKVNFIWTFYSVWMVYNLLRKHIMHCCVTIINTK